jgi:hypothetical protein
VKFIPYSRVDTILFGGSAHSCVACNFVIALQVGLAVVFLTWAGIRPLFPVVYVTWVCISL